MTTKRTSRCNEEHKFDTGETLQCVLENGHEGPHKFGEETEQPATEKAEE